MSGGVCWYLWYLVLSLGVWGGVVVYPGGILECLSCLGVFRGVSEGSARVGSSQDGADPPFWPNSERQDFFT